MLWMYNVPCTVYSVQCIRFSVIIDSVFIILMFIIRSQIFKNTFGILSGKNNARRATSPAACRLRLPLLLPRMRTAPSPTRGRRSAAARSVATVAAVIQLPRGSGLQTSYSKGYS
jgi:hypothetical protein